MDTSPMVSKEPDACKSRRPIALRRTAALYESSVFKSVAICSKMSVLQTLSLKSDNFTGRIVLLAIWSSVVTPRIRANQVALNVDVESLRGDCRFLTTVCEREYISQSGRGWSGLSQECRRNQLILAYPLAGGTPPLYWMRPTDHI